MTKSGAEIIAITVELPAREKRLDIEREYCAFRGPDKAERAWCRVPSMLRDETSEDLSGGEPARWAGDSHPEKSIVRTARFFSQGGEGKV